MIRLEIYGSGDATAQQVFARLCGATEATPDDSEAAVLWAGLGLIGLAEDLLGKGRHVLIPVEAIETLDSLDRLTHAAQRGRSNLAIVNPQRYQASRQFIKQQIDAGKLGRVGLVRMHRWERDRGGPLPDVPARLLGDLDLAVWLVGNPPETVYAVGSQNASFLQVHLGIPGGAMMLLDFTARLPPGDEYRSLSVIGSSGAAHADDQHNVQLLYLGGAAQTQRAGGGVRHMTAVVQAFVDDLAIGRDFTSDIAAWRRMQQIAPAIRESLGTGRAIRLEDWPA